MCEVRKIFIKELYYLHIGRMNKHSQREILDFQPANIASVVSMAESRERSVSEETLSFRIDIDNIGSTALRKCTRERLSVSSIARPEEYIDIVFL